MYNLVLLSSLIQTAHLNGHHDLKRKLQAIQADMDLKNLVASAPKHAMAAWRERCQEPEVSLGDLSL